MPGGYGVVCHVLGGDEGKQSSIRLLQSFLCYLGDFAQVGLGLQEGMFVRVEVGAVGRQIMQLGVGGSDGCQDSHTLAGAEVDSRKR